MKFQNASLVEKLFQIPDVAAGTATAYRARESSRFDNWTICENKFREQPDQVKLSCSLSVAEFVYNVCCQTSDVCGLVAVRLTKANNTHTLFMQIE